MKWYNGWSVSLMSSRRPEFNPGLGYTKNSKNGT